MVRTKGLGCGSTEKPNRLAPGLDQTLPIPGPSTNMKNAVQIKPAAIQGMLRATPSGGSIARDVGERGIAKYHASSDVAPREPAAAEIRTSFMPSGLSSPAAIIVA